MTAEKQLFQTIPSPNILVRHARLTSILWFSVFAFLAASLVERSFSRSALYAAFAAVLPAAMVGARILNSEEKLSILHGIGAGAVVVTLSHLIYCCLVFAPVVMETGLFRDGSFALLPMFVLMSFLYGGWLTYPVGCIAGAFLLVFRNVGVRGPRGCGVHGYTSPTTEVKQ